ncbi:MAG: carbohydrate porin [Piscinibacter sp.]|uniref:maltoporin n=1 Tax=Piscinibacter sp. TaxID=1903157 RepID=UPI00258F1798|nr:carbohydrate porin [Piscinibacter sp.]MCW5664727.1 carbohydrate porin [Piscinibacter sp.]
MRTRSLPQVAAVALGVLLAGTAAAVPVDFGGYFRSGAGSSSEGGKEVCYRLPGSVLWFRLGNECDTYADLVFRSTLGQVDGTTFKSTFRFSYGTQGIANWEQTSPSFREVFVEAQDIGAGMGLPALEGASLWAGKRFYGNRDIHMLDYGFWEPNQGVGFGLENVDAGIGKFSYALMRIGDFTGYGINPSLGGFNPDLIGGGSRTVSVHDFRLEGIETNPGGKVSLGLDLSLKNNRDGRSTYTVDTVQPIDIDNDPATPPVNVVVRETRSIDNQAGRNGLGLHVQHTQDDLFGLGGFNQVVLKVAKNAMTLRGWGIAGSTEKRTEWLLFDHWVIEPKGMPVTASFTAGTRQAKVEGVTNKEVWIGARPQYHLNNVWSLMSELGYQQARSDGDTLGTRKLAKATVGTQFSMGRSLWARPAIRFFVTYAKWNNAAARAGTVTCTGRDCNTPVDAFGDKRSGVSYGMQVEGWF